MSMRAKNWAVFISGTGSNLGSLIENSGEGKIVLVVSSKKNAQGLCKARRAGIPTFVMAKNGWEQLEKELERFGVEKIFLAGFMRIVPASFVKKWEKKMVNIHPSLLPKFPGLNSIERAFKANERLGVTLHEVVADVDAGPILVQGKTETAKTIEDSEFLVHVAEQRLARRVWRAWQ